MDCSTIEHSDSDSGDSWTLIENSTYADDAPDIPDHPTESNTAENHDKDEDTDGISIITDSEPESSSPCQISYEHYLSEENSTSVHHLPQFITVNSDLHENKSHNESKEDDDDLLGENGVKHKTYVHRRNKRLSTVLNIVMLGSVITAAGVAIGHMWGAKTDCSMHTPSNVNKILSNLYKLQEENAYLWSKLKELTAFNNYQINQQKTMLKQNKCKKMFEEPLVNNDSKKVTKCVDDMNYDKLMNSHMAEAAKKEKPDEFLNETKDLTNERKSYADSLKYFGKMNVKENQAFKSEKKHSNENHKLLKRSYDSEVGSSLNDINKHAHVNNKEYFKNNHKLRGDHGYEGNLSHKNNDLNRLRGESSLYDEFLTQESNQNINKKENNKTTKDEIQDSDRNKTPNGALDTEEEFLKSIKDKNRKNNKKSQNKNHKSLQKKYKDIDNNETPKGDYGTEELFRGMEHRILKGDKILIEFAKEENFSNSVKGKNPNKKYQKEKTNEIKTRGYNINQTPQGEFGNKVESPKSVKDKVLKKYNKSESRKAVKTERTDFERNKTSKDENDAEKIVVKTEKHDFNINKNTNAEYDYQFDSNEDDIKKDNRYVSQKQKPERKKYDRQQLYKKNKKRNKYEQWEMKGGLFKDFDEISTISSQDKEYLFEPNLMDDKEFIRQLGDNKIDNNIDILSDNLNHNAKNTKMHTDNEDEINWLDKRAKFRKQARLQLEEESFNKNGDNGAGWYFKRMRKREQSRGKGDNGTYRKFLKHNFKLKH